MLAWLMVLACQGEGTPGTATSLPTIPWQPNPPPDRTTEPTEIDTAVEKAPLELVACDPDLVGSYALPTTTGCVGGRQALLVESYLAIPYAEPPVGPLRWARTVPVSPTPIDEKTGWAVPIDGREAGPACMQTYGTDDGALGQGEGSEDCLTLNVFRPRETEPDQGLPILVFLHGGGFLDGSSTQEELVGESFAKPLDEQPFPPAVMKLGSQAIVVTVNYRLGPLGFLSHRGLAGLDPDGVTGNQGLWDVLEALRWIHTNAGALGGTRDAITVFGESEGAVAACSLMTSPEATGLATSVVLMGGGCTQVDHSLNTPGSVQGPAFDQGDTLAEAMGCDDAGSDADVVACMRERSPEQIVATLRGRRTPLRDGPVYGPVVDGRLLPLSPAEQFAKGTFDAVPVVGGANAEAGARYASRDAVSTDEELADALDQLAANLGLPAKELIALYDPSSYGDDPQEALVAALTDAVFLCPTREVLDAVSPHANTYAYRFDHETIPGSGPSQFDMLGYVFGTLDAEHPGIDVSEAVREAWISVAEDAPAFGSVGAWPTMGPVASGGGTWLSIDDQSVITLGVRRDTCDALSAMRP